MHDSQTIDLRDDLAITTEQHRVLDRIAELSNTHGARAWSEDHGLEQLLERYEGSVWLVGA